MDDCMGGRLYSAIENKGRMHFVYAPNLSGTLQGQYGRDTLRLKSLDDEATLFHELGHRLQHVEELANQSYNGFSLNHEIEIQYATYLYRKKQPDYNTKWKKHYEVDPGLGRAISGLKNFINPKGNLLCDEDDEMFHFAYGQVITELKKLASYSDMELDSTRSMSDNFKYLRQIALNC